MKKLYCGDSAEVLRNIETNSVDMTLTSPPYDELRDYNGYVFDFEAIANELYRVTKPGGVVVWIVADGVINGSKSGTSFTQALFFKNIGFNIHDVMIWAKPAIVFPCVSRYGQSFEYMFIFSKGAPKTVNKIKDKKNICYGDKITATGRQKDGSIKVSSGKRKGAIIQEYGERLNVWNMPGVNSNNERTGHPAQFPLRLAKDHIISWSNKADVVLDPFMGSGTTGVACYETQRDFIGIEISKEYFNLAKKRIEEAEMQIIMNI